MKRKNIKTAFVLEMKALFSSMRAYVYLTVALLGCLIYVAYLNFYNGISELEYSLRYISLPLMLAMPALTVGSFSEGRDRMLRSLGTGTAELLFGRLCADALTSVMPLIPLLILPPVLGTMGKVGYLSAYLGIFSTALFCLALTSALTLISALCPKRKLGYAVSYGFCVLLYLGNIAYSVLPISTLPLAAAALVLSGAFCAALYGFTRDLTASLTVFSVLTVVFCLICVTEKSFAYTLIKGLLGAVLLNSSLNSLLSSDVFNIAAALSLILFAVTCALLSVICLEKRRTE